jgi:hypothetical protein
MFHTGATFFLLPTRAWELLIGCMLAVFPWQCESSPRRDSSIAALGVLAIALPVFLYDSETPFPGLAAAPPVLGTAAIIFATANTPRIWLCKVLSLRPFVFIGLFSYSLYLWHWPVIVYTRTYFGHFDWKQVVFASVVSISLAILSWRFIETPCRRNTFLQRHRRLFGTAFFMSGTTVAVSILLVATGGLPSRFPNYSPVLLEDTTWKGHEYGISLREDFRFDTLPSLGMEIDETDDDKRLDFILWGDSHGMVLCPAISDVAAECGLSGKAVVASGQVPLLGVHAPNRPNPRMQIRFNQNVRELLKTRRPRNLILVSRWSWYTNGYLDVELKSNPSFSATEYLQSSKLNAAATPESSMKALVQGLQELASLCEECDVLLWVVKQVPEVGGSSPANDVFLWSVGRRNQMPDYRRSLKQYSVRQTSPEKIFGSISSVGMRVLDPAPYLFSEDQMTILVQDGRSCYRDEDHLTRHGAERLRDLIKGVMLEIRRDNRLGSRGTCIGE